MGVARTVKKSYVRLTLPPGPHEIISKAEKDVTLNLQTEANKIYYVWQEVKMGLLYARCKLNVMEEAKAQVDIRECELLAAEE